MLKDGEKPYQYGSSKSDILIRIPELYYNLVLTENHTAIEVARKIRSEILTLSNRCISIKGLQDSSHDYDQTVHRTIDLEDLNSFWSSGPSDTADHKEWLLYEVYESPCLISSVMITVFRALFQLNDPIFPPSKVRFKIGLTPSKYHYTSPLFEFENNAEDQHFSLLPDIVIGKYILVEMYGKPMLQNMDNKHYIALQKVAIHGSPLNRENFSSMVLPTLDKISETESKRIESEGGEEKKRDTFTQEELKETENILLNLASGEMTLGQFRDQYDQSVYEFATERRIVLMSDTLLENLDSPSQLSETNRFYTSNNILNQRNQRVSIIKLILCFLFDQQQTYGIWDRVNTEIFYKTFFALKDSIEDLNVLLNFSFAVGVHPCKDQDLYEKYFEFDQELPDPFKHKFLTVDGNEEEDDDEPRGRQFNMNYLKTLLLQAVGFDVQNLKFLLEVPGLDIKEVVYRVILVCQRQMSAFSHFNAKTFSDVLNDYIDRNPNINRDAMKKLIRIICETGLRDDRISKNFMKLADGL